MQIACIWLLGYVAFAAVVFFSTRGNPGKRWLPVWILLAGVILLWRFFP